MGDMLMNSEESVRGMY